MPAPLRADAERELEELAEQYLARLEAGELLDRDALLRAHPDLGDRLDRRLALLSRMSPTRSEPGPPYDPPITAVRASGAEGVLTTPPLPVPPQPAVVPPHFPGYEVLEELGRGGMGIVYKARQTGLHRLVALKIILAGASARLEERIRFQLEGEALASLQHSNVVQVYEVGEQDGVPFLALEYVDGITLEQALAGEPVAPREAAQLVEVLARAMQHAHQHGVIHRDLKPANVLLQQNTTLEVTDLTEGQKQPSSSSVLSVLSVVDFVPKITDFGLAKRIGGDSGATRPGIAVGTPCYMAPEQARAAAGRMGPATDVYALGAILYQCLTGRPPFLGETTLETLQRVVAEEPVPPSRRCAGVPRDLDVICLKCLAKELPRRYPTAEALADDLRRFLDGEPIRARAVGRLERLIKWVRRRPALAALALVSGLALAGLAGLELRVRAERDRAEKSLHLGLDAVEELMTEVSEEHLADEPRLEEYRRVMLSRALAYYRRFLEVHHDDPRLHAETAQAARRVGDALRLLGHYREAEQAYHEAITQLDPLAREQDGRSRQALALASCHTDLGEVLRLTDQTVAARREFDRALEIEDEVLARDAGDTTWLQEKARTLYNLGILMRLTGQMGDAKKFLGDAVAVLEGLAGRFEAEPRYRQHLARSYLNLGTALRDANEYTLARTNYQQAITILTKLTGGWPRVADYRHELAIARNNLGNLLADRKRLEEALTEHDEARKHFAMLADDFPRVPKYGLELANTENSRARVLSRKNDLPGARQALERARDRLAKLVGEPDAAPAWHADLGRTCGNLGVILYLQAKRQDARDHFQNAIRHLEKACEKNRANPDYLAALRENYRNLSETFLQLGEPRQAAQAAETLARESAGLPRETYFAACFMARCAAADHEDHARRVALALNYLQAAVAKGFDDFSLFQKDRTQYFVALEGEAVFRLLCEQLKAKAGRSSDPSPPKR